MHLSNSFRFVVKDNRIFDASDFFLSIMNPLVVLYQPAMIVSDTWWHLLSSECFSITAVFCWHNITGINGPKWSFTESLVAFTIPRMAVVAFTNSLWWQLLYGDVVYKSAVSPILGNWTPEIDPKKVPGQKYIFLPVYQGTIAQLFTNKNSHFTFPLNKGRI